MSNEGISSPGVKLHGAGFIVSPAVARVLGLGTHPGVEAHIREYRNGRDLTAIPRGAMVIDLYGLTEADARARFPAVYQHVLDKVKPERDQNNRQSYKRYWWIHGEPRKELRPPLADLGRYVVTPVTAKHRFFVFLDSSILADDALICIASDRSEILAVLSSNFHLTWASHAGSTLEDRPRYLKTSCFDPFPFPSPTEAQKTRLRSLGEQLDAHRKAQQAAHPKLTLTAMYNVLEKLRAGERIEGKDREIYDQGLIGILRDLHDQIDREVAAAYGWPADLSDDEILHRLVDLNRTRAAEEARGLVRWLRPDYQNPQGRAVAAKGEQTAMDIGPAVSTDKTPWPKTLPEQIAAVRATLQDMGEASPDQIARRFHKGRVTSVLPLLESLAMLHQARISDDGRFSI